MESFTDRSVLHEYRRRAGLPEEPSDKELDSEDDHHETSVSPKERVSKRVHAETNDEEESLDEDEYEVEAIVGHHLSDPRTHPPTLGEQPVMLYRVKWKGYEDLTWEPASSFANLALIRSYSEYHGLEDDTVQSNVDKEMAGSM